MADPTTEASCSLDEPRIRAVLARIHGEASAQKGALLRLGVSWLTDKVLRRHPSVAADAGRMKDLYISLSPKQGRFAYLVARSLGARRIVEFGTSFGISTIYLAAAVRDNGGGIVIGSELESGKVARARANIDEAGLSDQVEVREGDARETLADPGGPVDMALMDGHKELYLPIIEMLTPHLRPGAVVLGDNIFTFRTALRPYVVHMQDLRNGFQSVTLHLGDGTEYSVRL